MKVGPKCIFRDVNQTKVYKKTNQANMTNMKEFFFFNLTYSKNLISKWLYTFHEQERDVGELRRTADMTEDRFDRLTTKQLTDEQTDAHQQQISES